MQDAARRTTLLCQARGDTIAGLRETLRLVVAVMALREHCPFARPMGERGRPIEATPSYLQRPIPRRAPLPPPRRPPHPVAIPAQRGCR